MRTANLSWKRWSTAIVLVAMSATGCASEPLDVVAPAESDEPLEVATYALTNTTCNDASATSQSCSGGWIFEPICEREDRACGVQYECGPNDYGTCMAPATGSMSNTKTIYYPRRSDPGTGVSASCAPPQSLGIYDLSGVVAKDFLARLRQEVPQVQISGSARTDDGGVRTLKPLVITPELMNATTVRLPNSTPVKNVDAKDFSFFASVSFATDPHNGCKATVRIMGHYGPSAYCTCLRPTEHVETCIRPAQVCSPTGDAKWGYAVPGTTATTLSSLRSPDPAATQPTCMSCESLPMSNLTEKWKCLTGNLDASTATTTTLGVVEPETTRAGNDYKDFATYYDANTARDCIVACNNDPVCVATTFVGSTKRCWLKNRIPAPTAATNKLTYVKTATGGRSRSAPPIAAQMKLVAELRGHQLDEAALKKARALYTAYPTSRVSCSPAGDISTRYPSLTSLTNDDKFSVPYCEALMQSHVSNELRTREFRRCARFVGGLADQNKVGAGDSRELANFLTNFYAASLESLRQTSDHGAIQFHLNLMQEWLEAWDKLARVSGRQADRADAISSTVAALWALLYELQSPAADLVSQLNAPIVPDGNPEHDEGYVQAQRVAAFGQRVRLVSAEVTAAALSPQPATGTANGPDGLPLRATPVASSLLSALLEDAFTELVRELSALSAYHDVACAVIDTCQAAPADSPLEGYWAALAEVTSPTELRRVLDVHGPGLGPWRKAFEAVHADAGARVSAALADARERGEDQILALIDQARQRHTAFKAGGVFDPRTLSTLVVGMDRADRTRVLDAVATAQSTLNVGIQEYERGIERLLAVGADNLAGTHLQGRLDDERARLQAEYDQMTVQYAGLQAAMDASDRTFNSITESWNQIEHSVDDGSFVPVGSTPLPVTVPSNGARPGPDKQFAFSNQAVASDLAAGTMLVVEAQGRYSPACALSKVKTLAPNGLGDPVSIGAAPCGPEGYELSWSNSRYTASAHSDYKTNTSNQTVGVKGEVCVKSESGLPGGTGVSNTVTASACAYADVNWQWSQGERNEDSSGSDARTQAAFSGGLRLKSTPFPDAPAGSLLLLLINKNEQGFDAVYDVVSLRAGANTVIIDKAGTTAVVAVNDVPGCADNVYAASNLTVQLRTLRPSGDVAEKLVETMVTVLADFRKLLTAADGAVDYVAQGFIPPSQLAELRSQAQLKLKAALDGPTGIPEAAQSLFDAFVSHELANLERRVQMSAIDQKLDLMLLQLAANDHERRRAEESSAMKRLLVQRTVQHLDEELLRDQAEDTIEIVHAEFLPVLDLWYPSALSRLRSSLHIRKLRAVDLGMNTIGLADVLHNALDEFLDEYELASRRQERPSAEIPDYAAVAFRRPSAGGGLGGGLGDGHSPDGPDVGHYFPTVDDARAKMLWDAIDARDWGLVHLDPEDVFGPGDGKVTCGGNVPVVEQMGLFFIRSATDDEELNNRFRKLDVVASSHQPFPVSEGWKNYNLQDGIWTRYEVPVLYGPASLVLDEMTQNQHMRAQRPIGLSMFGDIEVDFREFAAIEAQGGDLGIENATAVVLAYRIGTRPGDSLDWVRTCAQQGGQP